MFYLVKYVGGYPKWDTPCSTVIFVEDGAIKFTSSGQETFYIHIDDILDISYDRQSSRNVGKAVGGALIGGVLTGGVGLLVGGAVGARKKDLSELFITYSFQGQELTLSIISGKKTDEIYADINSLFNSNKPVQASQITTSEPTIDEIIESGVASSENESDSGQGQSLIGCMVIAIIIILIIYFCII